MKPILNMIHDVIEKYLVNVPDDKKDEYKEVGIEVIKAIAEGAAKGASEQAMSKIKDNI